MTALQVIKVICITLILPQSSLLLHQHICLEFFCIYFNLFISCSLMIYFHLDFSSIKFPHLYIRNQKFLPCLRNFIRIKFVMEVSKTYITFSVFDHPNVLLNREPTFKLFFFPMPCKWGWSPLRIMDWCHNDMIIECHYILWASSLLYKFLISAFNMMCIPVLLIKIISLQNYCNLQNSKQSWK